MTAKKVLVTGGAGYIGSHMTLLLQQHGFEVFVLDNFSNSHGQVLKSIEFLSGKKVHFFQEDIRDSKALSNIFSEWKFDAVFHFAGLKCVGDSIKDPISYYENNVVGTLNLLKVMSATGVHCMVFSSSANIYGDAAVTPIEESSSPAPTNPYGATKAAIESVLQSIHLSDTRWKIACLRYFNPVGAHPSGLIGELPVLSPTNIMPVIAQVASGLRKAVTIFGNDYDTPDGTGIRDFIHVMDLVEGHLAAFNSLGEHRYLMCNLGTGVGYSVLQLIKTFSQVNDVEIPYVFANRRDGDIPVSYASTEKSRKLMNWKAVRSLSEMCIDQWSWQKQCMKIEG